MNVRYCSIYGNTLKGYLFDRGTTSCKANIYNSYINTNVNINASTITSSTGKFANIIDHFKNCHNENKYKISCKVDNKPMKGFLTFMNIDIH